MIWVACVQCKQKKFVGALDIDPEEFLCSRDCSKLWDKAHPPLGPKVGFGTRSMTAKSKRESKKLDSLIGGKVVPGSGAVPGLDGDRITGLTMIEEKVTDASSFRLTRQMWEKLIGEAAKNGKHSALVLRLGPHRIVMLPLAEALERLEEGL
jgi:hypothetical protein